MEVLKTGSVEAASLANNHSYDYGNDGYWDTFKPWETPGSCPSAMKKARSSL